jgi:ABC-type antimicrobial peptide transport system permease subunit
MAMGASPRNMMTMVLRQGLTLALTGLVVGSVAAAALARLAAALLVSVSTVDPIVYAGVAVFTIAVALLSAAIPAWRALRVDPMVALRYE